MGNQAAFTANDTYVKKAVPAVETGVLCQIDPDFAFNQK